MSNRVQGPLREHPIPALETPHKTGAMAFPSKRRESTQASHATIPAAAVVYENLERADEGRSGTPLRVDDLEHFFLG